MVYGESKMMSTDGVVVVGMVLDNGVIVIKDVLVVFGYNSRVML